jgi:hypothetical protein
MRAVSEAPRTSDTGTRGQAGRGFAASLLVLLVTGILLLRHDLRPSTRAMVAGTHALLALATATYGLRSLLRLFRLRLAEFPLGWMLVLATGVLGLSFGATRDWAFFAALHALVATTYGASQLVPRRLAFLGAPLLGLLMMSVSWDLTTEKRPTSEDLPPVGPIDPDQGGGFVDVDGLPLDDATRFTDPGRCNGCHLNVSPAHAQSAHRHASVTNPYYLHAARDLRDKRGPEAVALCAGCHDLGLLAHRKLDEGIHGGPEQAAAIAPGADIGVPCLACHGSTQVLSQRGGGALALSLPDDPVVRADGVRHTLSFWMTYVDPRSHREAMMPPDGRSSTRCGTCHQATLHAGINGLRHTRGQVDRDEHRASVFFPGAGVSGRLPLGRGPRSCADCHLVERDTGHRMGAANTALAAAHGDDVLIADITRYLREGPEPERGPPVGLGVVWLDGDRFELGAGFTATTAGSVEVHVVVSNEGVGHLFPGGTLDTTQLWLELEVTDAEGHVIAKSTADERGLHGVHRLGRVVVDADGNDVVAHLTTELHTPLFDHTLAPGHANIGRFALDVPGPGAYQARAVVKHKKFAEAFSEAVGVDASRVPTVTVADLSNPLEPEVLLARYIDAAARDWDDARAARASMAGERRYTTHLEVKLARARFLIDRKRDPQAASRVLGGDSSPQARFQQARALLLGGDPQSARDLTEQLLETFGEDIELLRLDATILRRLGRREEALDQLSALLDRRPDDFAALQTAMAIAGERSEASDVEAYRAAAERVRPARDATAAANSRAAGDSAAALEADRLHVHRLSNRANAPAEPDGGSEPPSGADAGP